MLLLIIESLSLSLRGANNCQNSFKKVFGPYNVEANSMLDTELKLQVEIVFM